MQTQAYVSCSNYSYSFNRFTDEKRDKTEYFTRLRDIIPIMNLL